MSKHKKKYVTYAISGIFAAHVLVLSGCGGRTANPVMAAQYGDQTKSCEALEFEMTQVQGEMQRLLPKTDKTGKNAALGVTGFFLVVPLFFMDFKNADKVEYEAYRQRYNNLASYAISKDCGVDPVDYPSIDEMKAAYEKQQRENESNKGLQGAQ